jgi:hypothetical protein
MTRLRMVQSKDFQGCFHSCSCLVKFGVAICTIQNKVKNFFLQKRSCSPGCTWVSDLGMQSLLSSSLPRVPLDHGQKAV